MKVFANKYTLTFQCARELVNDRGDHFIVDDEPVEFHLSISTDSLFFSSNGQDGRFVQRAIIKLFSDTACEALSRIIIDDDKHREGEST